MRQQTLRNTLRWSYDLLDEGEQRLFRRLSVFVDGWTLEAVEAMATAGQESGGDVLSPLEGVASLLDKSLLLQIEQEGEVLFQGYELSRGQCAQVGEQTMQWTERVQLVRSQAVAQRESASYSGTSSAGPRPKRPIRRIICTSACLRSTNAPVQRFPPAASAELCCAEWECWF